LPWRATTSLFVWFWLYHLVHFIAFTLVVCSKESVHCMLKSI
jgi:hypothetical protein